MRASITIPENAIIVDWSKLPLYWDGVRWSTINPADKITIASEKAAK